MAVEVVEVVQALKRTKGDETKIAEIMEGKGARLMKSDLLAVLEELQRQGMWFLAHKVRGFLIGNDCCTRSHHCVFPANLLFVSVIASSTMCAFKDDGTWHIERIFQVNGV